MNLRDPQMTIARMVEQVVARYGRKKCLTYDQTTYTYRVVNQKMNQVAHGLRKLGIAHGSRVGLLLSNCPEYIFTYFGVLKLGAINVPINTFLSSEEVQFILNDCEIATLITETALHETLKAVLPNLPHLKHVIVVDGEIPGTLPFQTFAKESIENPVVPDPPTNRDIAVIHYTSGTTGKPKGAMLSHKNLLAAIDANTDVIKISHRDKIIVFLPLFHVFTFVVCILATFSHGTRIVLLNSVKPFKRVLKALFRYRINILVGVPPIFNALANVDVPWFFRFINPIRVCISGGAPLTAEVLRNFQHKFQIPLLEGYGLSETSGGVCVNPLDGVQKPLSIGLPIKGVRVKVIDEDDLELGPNEVGELLIKSDSVMEGYYHQPEETAAVLRDGWLHTGDMAKIDSDGYIYIVDRKKDMLIVRGMNVYPREVEEVLSSHPKVAECAVIGVPDKQRGEVPKAIITLKENVTATEKEFRRFCHEKIAMYKNPKYFEFRDQLPKTPTGKVMKKVLKQEEFEKLQARMEGETVSHESAP
ncbi:long-chain-fatty-acid--CoA ligase [candidate division KSB3 bacterium]|uniref:Long-chain-fatty-acid--CoA ligase n=1 Tax=candidate division KSB3 bacterium TaxID=2044937 RepID=A0A9D5JVF9_9BACT|nr:long-chain-fatty-acid--CoA ligase [candidate division KSB3 bacterium]MBD3324873.1 long-chain-fatty-acid--CoA ligase [candidate division KSB3 bacterium]